MKPATQVRVSSQRGSVVVTAMPDPTIPVGIAVLPFNLPGGGAGELIDASGSLYRRPPRARGGAMNALLAYTGDPLFAKGLDLVVWMILLVKLIVGLCPLDALGALHGHVRAQGDSSARDPLGAEPSRPVRLAAVSRRRHQAVLQGGDAPRQRRQARVPDRPRYSGGACVRGLFDRARRRDDHRRRLHDPPPAGRPVVGHPGHADGLERHGLRGDVGRVGVRVEVPLDRRGARKRTDDLLRGRPRLDRRNGRVAHAGRCIRARSSQPSTAGSCTTGTSSVPSVPPPRSSSWR